MFPEIVFQKRFGPTDLWFSRGSNQRIHEYKAIFFCLQIRKFYSLVTGNQWYCDSGSVFAIPDRPGHGFGLCQFSWIGSRPTTTRSKPGPLAALQRAVCYPYMTITDAEKVGNGKITQGKARDKNSFNGVTMVWQEKQGKARERSSGNHHLRLNLLYRTWYICITSRQFSLLVCRCLVYPKCLSEKTRQASKVFSHQHGDTSDGDASTNNSGEWMREVEQTQSEESEVLICNNFFNSQWDQILWIPFSDWSLEILPGISAHVQGACREKDDWRKEK